MSLFGSNAPSAQEVARENLVKASVTENLQRTIKAVQRLHVTSEEPIHSEETANAVCNILEAVFIHGLKGSLSKKIPGWGLLTNDQGGKDIFSQLTFWGLLTKVTHKDTISQLNHLGQITTEIGMCRAWIRLALNDNILESYLTALLADPKSLSKYYKRTAYLRDSEQPTILMSLVQGLSMLGFQLSYNSSMLNVWTRTPLVLAGLAQPQDFPRAVVGSRSDTSITLVSGSEPQTEMAVEAGTSPLSPGPFHAAPVAAIAVLPPTPEAVVTQTKSRRKKRAKMNERMIGSQSYPEGILGAGPSTPQNTPVGAAQLSMAEIDEIRMLSSLLDEDEGSGGSTAASQISHPDSYDAREHQKYMVGAACRSNASQDGSSMDASLDASSSPLGTSPQSPTAPMHQSSHTSHSRNKAKKKRPAFTVGSPLSDEVIPELPEQTPTPGTQQIDIKDLFPSLSENIGASEQSSSIINAQSNEESAVSEDALPELNDEDVNDAEADASSATVAPPVSSLASRRLTAPGNLTLPPSCVEPEPQSTASPSHAAASAEGKLIRVSSLPQFSPKGKSPPLEPEMSTVTARGTRVEVAIEALTNSNDTSEAVVMDLGEPSPEPQGNSLGMMQGWSSDFEPGQRARNPTLPPYTATEEPGPAEQLDLSTPQGMARHLARLHTESFNDLLSNYGGTAGQVEAASMSAVLETLADPYQTSSSSTTPAAEDIANLPKQASVESEVFSEYDILPDNAGDLSVLDDPNMQPLLEIVSELCTEKGLDMQNYQCKTCSRPIGMFYGKARVCGYDSAYYCYECHENEEYHIPSKIMHNWDFRMYKVSRRNLEFLRKVEDEPLLHIQKVNPRLYDHVTELDTIKELRTQLRFLKAYLFTCKQSVADELRRQVWPKEYYYDDIHLYSLMDLFQVPPGQLAATLKKVIKFASSHVYGCRLCSQKGFICEICANPQVIYPFEMESTTRCERCRSVYHSACKTEVVPCPKCQRRRQRTSTSSELGTPDSLDDYAFIPPKL